MPIKLRAIGCRIVDAETDGEAVTEFWSDEVEILAELEHRCWNAERWLSGWTFGEKTDRSRKIHNCLVPYEKLPQEIREYDREMIRKIPGLLAKVRPAMKVVRKRITDPLPPFSDGPEGRAFRASISRVRQSPALVRRYTRPHPCYPRA
jgi:hypothetical protein